MREAAPEAFVMRRESWQMFATLTFAQRSIRLARTTSPLFSWLREISNVKGVAFKSLLWVARVEAGELNGRLHYHVVLSGLPQGETNKSTAGLFQRLWEKGLRFGMADVRLWDGRDALSYISKGLDMSLAGANLYESAKFGLSQSRVIFGETFTAKWSGVQASPNTKTSVLNSGPRLAKCLR